MDNAHQSPQHQYSTSRTLKCNLNLAGFKRYEAAVIDLVFHTVSCNDPCYANQKSELNHQRHNWRMSELRQMLRHKHPCHAPPVCSAADLSTSLTWSPSCQYYHTPPS
uniref:Uncharacterized protein n=1 Tax=Lygus hesperus TaxID=30085 RepID=A0A146LZK1_LYGHE